MVLTPSLPIYSEDLHHSSLLNKQVVGGCVTNRGSFCVFFLRQAWWLKKNKFLSCQEIYINYGKTPFETTEFYLKKKIWCLFHYTPWGK